MHTLRLRHTLPDQVEVDEAGHEVVLGEGSFGTVVRGTYRLRPVAIKRLVARAPEQQEQIVREAAILEACAGNRHIVPFVGACLRPVRGRTQHACACMTVQTDSCSEPACRHMLLARCFT